MVQIPSDDENKHYDRGKKKPPTKAVVFYIALAGFIKRSASRL